MRVRELVGDELGHQLHALARLDEADRPRALDDQRRDHVRRLRHRGAPRLQRLVGDRRVPHRDLPRRPRRAVAVDVREAVDARQVLGQLDRVGDRRGRHQDQRLAPRVGDAHAPQPPQDVAHVRPEDAAVDVRLVDHHDVQVHEEVRPRRVVGQDPGVQHVRVGQDQVRALADRAAVLALGVAVVDRRAHGAAQPERRDRPQLVLGQRLRGVEVQRARRRDRAQRVQRRDVEAQRLPGGGAGRHDERRPGRRDLDRLGLMGVELRDPGVGQPLHQRPGAAPPGSGAQQRRPRALVGLADQALVLAPVGEQLRPGFLGGGRRH